MGIDVNEKNISDNSVDEYSYSPRTRAASKKIPKKTKVKNDKKIDKVWFIVPGVIVSVILIVSVCLSATLPKNKVCDNVFVNSISVGGMNEAEVEEAVRDLIMPEDEFGVTSKGHRLSFIASDVELSVNSEQTARNVIAIGKSNNIFKNAYYHLKIIFGEVNVPFVAEYNQELLDTLLFEFGATFNGMSTGPQFEYTDDSLTIIPGTPGQNQDTSVARNAFLMAISEGEKNDIEVTLDYAEPQKLIAEEIYNEICKPVADAYYDKTEDGEIVVKEEVVGVEATKENLSSAVEKVNSGERATIPATIVKPAVTKEHLEQNLFSTTLGRYTTDFSSSSSNRATNVSRAAASINNVILMPGDEFSYNTTVGNPSAENGYLMASVYSNGKTAQGVGGGVCQVSSTLYSAVLYADLEVVERQNHSLTVDYVPKGQDATVAYGYIDFRFKNSTEYPVKISSVVSGRKLTVSLIGGAYVPQRKVEITNKTISTTEPVEKETLDATLPAGTRNVGEKGKRGYVIDTFKTVYEDGVEVSSQRITRSTYKMVPTEVIVGPTADTGVQEPAVDDAVSGNVSGDEVPYIDVVRPEPNTSENSSDDVIDI